MTMNYSKTTVKLNRHGEWEIQVLGLYSFNRQFIFLRQKHNKICLTQKNASNNMPDSLKVLKTALPRGCSKLMLF